MHFKIDKSFQNSRFYKNYNNIEHVILQFEKIKNEYINSKNKYKNVLNSLIMLLDKNQITQDAFQHFLNKNYDKNVSDSCNKILNEKIKISHNIKKYVKYTKNINDDFMCSIEIGNIKILIN